MDRPSPREIRRYLAASGIEVGAGAAAIRPIRSDASRKASYLGNYRISTTDRPVLMRLAIGPDRRLDETLRHEHDILGALPDNTGPRPYLIDLSRARLPCAARVEAFVDGRVPQHFDRRLIREVAVKLAILHRNHFAQCGRYPGASRRYVPRGLCLDDGVRLPEDLGGRMRDLVLSCAAHCAAVGKHYRHFDRFVILHNDLHLRNMIASESGLVLLDWEYARLGDGASDIAGLLWFSYLMGLTAAPFDADQRRAFLAAYVEHDGDRDIDDRVRLLEPIAIVSHAVAYANDLQCFPAGARSPAYRRYLTIMKRGIASLTHHSFRS